MLPYYGFCGNARRRCGQSDAIQRDLGKQEVMVVDNNGEQTGIVGIRLLLRVT